MSEQNKQLFCIVPLVSLKDHDCWDARPAGPEQEDIAYEKEVNK